jgi:hypothetical protein
MTTMLPMAVVIIVFCKFTLRKFDKELLSLSYKWRLWVETRLTASGRFLLEADFGGRIWTSTFAAEECLPKENRE